MSGARGWLPLRTAIAVGALLAAAGCAINPATGQRQLSLIGESQEIAIGRQNDEQIVAGLGLYDDPSVQAYVAGLGRSLAAVSERPDLPWTFRVVDDGTVNAFALPGGFVYVTRGIMAHLDSEAELAAVVGHEIGHVTARHGVNQMSKQQVLGGLLGVGMAVSESAARFGDVAEQALGLAFLKFSRDDERQADDLGLRYVIADGFDPRPMPSVYDTLRRVSEAAGSGRVPGWMSTHPQPENREARLEAAIAAMGRDFAGRPVRREEYLRQLDGLVFGQDPRDGYFEGQVFFHPRLAFRMAYPSGWSTANQRQAVVGASAERDAIVELTLSSAASAQAGLAAFLASDAIVSGAAWRDRIGGLAAASRTFRVTRDDGALVGVAAFVEYGGAVYRLLGYGVETAWGERRSAVETALASFARVTDRAVLDVQPERIRVVAAGQAETIGQLGARHGASVPAGTLALINRIDTDVRLTPGRSYKVVTGGR